MPFLKIFYLFSFVVVQSNSIFGNLNTKIGKTVSSLKPQSHAEDKQFLEEIAAINDVADKLSTLSTLPTIIKIHLSLAPLISAHSSSSAAVSDALKMLSAAAEKLATSAEKAYDGNAVVTVITNNEHSRRKRASEIDVSEFRFNSIFF